MLTYHLPSFLDYLQQNFPALYNNYVGRLMEVYPSAQTEDNNLFIVREEEETPSSDEKMIELWQEFKKERQY